MSRSEPAGGYENVVLQSWIDTHKKSSLTLLILLALVEGPAWSGGIRTFIDDVTSGALRVDEQSLHRALRRLDQTNLVTFQQSPAPGTGAKRKVYELTASGALVLRDYAATALAYERHPRYRALISKLLSSSRHPE